MKSEIKINKLKKALQSVKNGKFVHITCFNSIGYFFKFGKSKLAWKYTHFLIKNSYQLFVSGQSLSVDNLVPYSKKCEIYESVLECLEMVENQQTSENELQKKLQLALDEIRSFYPCDGYDIGFRRIYIHATRRKIFDVDLLLLNCCIGALQTKHISHYDLIEMTKFFCIDYANLRFKLNEKSISRFEKVIEFFEKQNTQ